MTCSPCHRGTSSAATLDRQPLKTRSLKVNITRREFAIGTGALALTGAAALAGFPSLGLPQPALAQDPSPSALMKAGPLGELVLGDEQGAVPIIAYPPITCPP